MSTFQYGDLVKYRNPSPGEEEFRMVITVWNTDRGFAKLLLPGWYIQPIELVREHDIELVERMFGPEAGETCPTSLTKPSAPK